MDARFRLDKDVLDRTPPEAVRFIIELLDENEELREENAKLKARLNQDSSNSSKPPSSDPPGRKRKPPQPKSGRARGAQPGHPRHERPLVPPEHVDERVECRPTNCEDCGVILVGNDPQPERHQVAEIPPIAVHVTEYVIHTLACPSCGGHTTGSLPAGTPIGCFGPRLAALISVLSGAYRLGKRAVQQLLLDLFGLSISTGMICKLQQKTATLLQGVYQDLRTYVRTQNDNIDETGWKENKKKAWLWVVVAPMVTVFLIARSRGKDVVEQLLGAFRFVATCDRWKPYRGLKRLQWCWAHLRRDFQAMIDREGAGKSIGEALLNHSNVLFHWWHRVRDGTLSRATFQKYVGWLRSAFREDLERGAACSCTKTAGTCRDLLEHEPWLWTFVWHEGIEPTNNAAERAARHAVLWRKSSGGTDSEAGSRFVERILSVVATCRQQARNVLDYLTDCHQAALEGKPAPSLLPRSDEQSRAA
jgi:transposase